MSGFALRPYQAECLQSIREAYKSGFRRQLVCLPTGTGKTVVFAQLPAFFRMRNRMVVLAHRDELLTQAREKILEANPGLPVGIERAEDHAPEDARIVIASVATLGRGIGTRLQRFNPDLYKIIVVDEAHHCVAETYKRILQYFGVLPASGPAGGNSGTDKLLLGVTATPKRGDQVGLGQIFEKIVYSRTLPDMIGAGFLCPIEGYRVTTDLDLSRVRTQHGDFVVSDLARAVNEDARNAILVKVYRELAAGRRTLVFCVDVAHAQAVAMQFASAGVPSQAVWGGMPLSERRHAITEFAEGKVQVLTNCNVLTEGFDEPKIECILMARPTQSGLLYTQMIGRGTRLAQGKSALRVLDIVDNSRKHKLASLPTLFGLPGDFDLKGKGALSVCREIERAAARYPFLNFGNIRSQEGLKVMIEKVNLIEPSVAPEVEAYARCTWVKMPDDTYRLHLGKDEWLVIDRNLLGVFEVRLMGGAACGRRAAVPREVGGRVPERGPAAGGAASASGSKIGETGNLPDAFQSAESFVRKKRPEILKLVGRNMKWRHEAATQKQAEALKRMRIPVRPNLKRGEASMLISAALSRRTHAPDDARQNASAASSSTPPLTQPRKS